MKKFSWQDTLKLNFLVLRLLGLWPRDKLHSSTSYTIYSTFVITCFLTAHTLFQVLNIFVVYSNLQNLSETIFITVTDVITLVKMYYLIKNSRTLKQLMMTLRKDMFQPKTHQINTVQADLTFWKNVSKALVVTVGSCLTLWCTFPLLDSNEEKRLPFLSWYPFYTKTSSTYKLTYIHQVLSILALASTNLNLDTLISALMMLVGAQCDILSDNIRHIKQENFNNEFRKCVEHHKAILKFSKDCNLFFNMIAFGQFFVSSACIAMTLFRLTVVSPFSNEFSSLSFYLGAAIQEIFLYCWFGNEVEIKSTNIVYSVFESDWINAPLTSKKSLLIFVIRCQKPIKMSAFNLVYLTLETYVSILRVSWSYFAVLRSINLSE